MKQYLHLLLTLLIIITIATISFPNITNQNITLIENKKIHFEGIVIRGQSYQQSINKTLNFKLTPTQYGWEIWVGSKTDNEANYCNIATPPFHGINAICIDGWHFRNSDNSANNEVGDKNVPAPQEDREFAFVLNKKDYKYVSKLLDKILYPQNISDKEQDDATDEFFSYRKGRGLLHIKDLELGNLILDQQAWIEKMEFIVDVEIPEKQ